MWKIKSHTAYRRPLHLYSIWIRTWCEFYSYSVQNLLQTMNRVKPLHKSNTCSQFSIDFKSKTRTKSNYFYIHFSPTNKTQNRQQQHKTKQKNQSSIPDVRMQALQIALLKLNHHKQLWLYLQLQHLILATNTSFHHVG